MTQVLFDRLKSNLAQCINDGTIYFVKDSNGNFTQIALGDGSKSHVVGIGPKMDDTTKQELMSKLGLTISSNMGTIQLGKLANHNGVSSQKVVTYERTGLGTDTHEISTVGYVQQYMKTAQAMVYAGLFNAQTKEITDYNNAIISPSEEGNVTFDYLLNGNEGETLLTSGMSFIVGTAGDLQGYTGISIYGGETKVEMGDMIIIIKVEQKESEEGGTTYNEASILVIQNTNWKISDGAITTAKLADEAVTSSKLSTDIQSLISNLSKTATFAGIATPTTNPGTPDGHVFYIANGKGIYTNFGGIDVTEDRVVILYWDTEWHRVSTGIASNDKLTELDLQINGNDGKVTIELSPINGKYYTGTVGTKITIGAHQDFSYCTPINVAEYVGKQITIERMGDDTSGALCAYGDDNDINIKRITHSVDFVQKGDIYVYEGIVPENAKTLYLSSRTSVLLSVRIVGERIEGLTDKVDSNTERIIALENNNDSKVSIQPQRFPILPYKVYEENGIYSVEDIYAKKVVDAKIYVHSINGLDTNNGTESAPLKTLKAALSKFNTLGKSAEVVIMDAATYYADELYGELGYQYSLIINAHKGATLINGVKTTYTKKNGYENVYECANTGKTLIGCVYVSDDNIDSFGLYKALNPVSSIALVDSTINSYYVENGIAYIHLADNSKVNDVIPIISGYGFRFTCLNKRDCFLYIKGLNVIGGIHNGARSSKADDGHILEYILEDCKYQNSMVGDMIPSNNFDVMYFVNIVGGFSKKDVFNHHANFMTESQINNSVVVCVNCLSEYAGWYGLHGVSGEPFINNLYTAHEGMNVLRINCRGQHSEGPMFADVNGCRSVNIECETINTFFTAKNVNINGCFTFNSTDSRKADITLNKCNGYDVRTLSLANCDAKLEGTNIDWSRVVANDISTLL